MEARSGAGRVRARIRRRVAALEPDAHMRVTPDPPPIGDLVDDYETSSPSLVGVQITPVELGTPAADLAGDAPALPPQAYRHFGSGIAIAMEYHVRDEFGDDQLDRLPRVAAERDLPHEIPRPLGRTRVGGQPMYDPVRHYALLVASAQAPGSRATEASDPRSKAGHAARVWKARLSRPARAATSPSVVANVAGLAGSEGAAGALRPGPADVTFAIARRRFSRRAVGGVHERSVGVGDSP